jgi:hypothetical protein
MSINLVSFQQSIRQLMEGSVPRKQDVTGESKNTFWASLWQSKLFLINHLSANRFMAVKSYAGESEFSLRTTKNKSCG